MYGMYGSYWLLAAAPVWAINVLFFIISLGLPALGTLKFEGKVTPFGVNVSWSGATLGDSLCLYSVMLIGWTIFRRGFVLPLWWTPSLLLWFHTFVFILSFFGWALFTMYTFSARQGHLLDRYHDLVAAPTWTYFIITLVPIIYLFGTWTELVAAHLLGLAWFGLLWFDLKTGRFVQPTWIVNNVVPFFNKCHK